MAGIPTAVMAERGKGGPVIAILGEYDALPALGQVSGVTEQEAKLAREPYVFPLPPEVMPPILA